MIKTKKYFFILFFCLFLSNLNGESLPHLILHFDVNKTLIASDEAGGKTVDQVLNQLLAEKFQACWDLSCENPITFQGYAKMIFPGEGQNLILKKQREAYINRFLEYLNATGHPFYPEVCLIYQTLLDKLQEQSGKVFSSFYKLLSYLDKNEISYSVILRSFGSEIYEIAEEINNEYACLFQFKGFFKERILNIEGEDSLSNLKGIYQRLSFNHLAIRDDWEYWVRSNMQGCAGKLFLLDQENKEVLQIFFDDNIELNNHAKNIIAVIDVQSERSLDIVHLLEKKHLVRVNTIEAIINHDYFTEYVKAALNERNSNKNGLVAE